MRSTFSAFAASLLLLSFATAQAQDQPKPCKDDVQKLCPGVKPGGGRIMQCLKENESKLSSACVARIKARHPCMKDAERLCKGVQPGEGRMAQCLKSHEAELSNECKQHHSMHDGHMEKGGQDKK